MEKLKRLFDYQRFAQNPELNKIICDVEKRYGLKRTVEDVRDPDHAAENGVTEKKEDGL